MTCVVYHIGKRMSSVFRRNRRRTQRRYVQMSQKRPKSNARMSPGSVPMITKKTMTKSAIIKKVGVSMSLLAPLAFWSSEAYESVVTCSSRTLLPQATDDEICCENLQDVSVERASQTEAYSQQFPFRSLHIELERRPGEVRGCVSGSSSRRKVAAILRCSITIAIGASCLKGDLSEGCKRSFRIERFLCALSTSLPHSSP